MKILRLVYEWPPPWIGLTPAPYELTKAQVSLGHDLTVFCGRWPMAGPQEKIQGVKLFSFLREPVRGTMLLTTAPLMTAFFLFWRLFNRVDFYHIHGAFGLYFYLYKLIFGFFDKGLVVSHFHISAKARWEEAVNEGKRISFAARFIDWPLSCLSDLLAVKIANSYVCVGEKVKEDLRKFYKVPDEKCHVVESGINKEIFTPCDQATKDLLKQKIGFESKDFILTNIGFLVERKNIHLLIESLVSLPSHFKLLLVGKREGSYGKRLDDLVLNLGLENRVKFVREVFYRDTPGFYHMSDLFVLPSSYEGFPKVVLEALGCGIPVIASGFELPEVKGLFELKNLDAGGLSDLIKAVSEKKTEVDFTFVHQNFSWEKRAYQLNSVYNSLI